MLKETIKNKINNNSKFFKIIFVLFWIIPTLLSIKVFRVFSFILYSYIFSYLYMENKIIKGIITAIFIIWFILPLPIIATYASHSFKEIILFILKIIFPVIPYGDRITNNP